MKRVKMIRKKVNRKINRIFDTRDAERAFGRDSVEMYWDSQNIASIAGYTGLPRGIRLSDVTAVLVVRGDGEYLAVGYCTDNDCYSANMSFEQVPLI